MRTDGAGKGSAFVPEEFAFEKAGWHGRAVHLDQVPVSARAELVNRSRDHLLAGAGLSGDQDRCIRARQGRYLGGTVARLPVLSLGRRCCRNSACAQLPCVETSESIASAPLCCPFPAKCAHHGCLISRVQSRLKLHSGARKSAGGTRATGHVREPIAKTSLDTVDKIST